MLYEVITGVHDLHLDGGGHVLPDSRGGEHDVWTDFPDVLLDGLGLLGKVDREAGEERAGETP